jgi:hypothetical protein
MGWGWSVDLSGPDRLCMAWLRYPLRCKSASAGWLVQSSDALPHRLPYVWRRVLLGVRNAVPLQRLMRSSAAPPAPPLQLNTMPPAKFCALPAGPADHRALVPVAAQGETSRAPARPPGGDYNWLRLRR